MGLNGMMAGGPTPGGDGDETIFTRDRAPTGREKRVRQAVVIGGVLLVLFVVWMYLQGGENRAIKAMSPVQREALFMETRESFRLMCTGDAGTRFIERCHKQAEFLMRFDECDEACRREIAPMLRNSVR